MIQIRLIATTCPYGGQTARIREAQWREQTASYPLSGKLAFLVFEIATDWEFSDYLIGLHDVPTEQGYIVAGTVHDFLVAARQFNTREYPHDVNVCYNYIEQKIKDFGYDTSKIRWT